MYDWGTIFAVLQSLLAAYGIAYISTAIGAPAWFLDVHSVNRLDDGRTPAWRFWVKAIPTVISVGVVVYSALYALIAAIPFDWGGHTEDGEWQSTRDSIRFFGTIFGTIGLCVQLERIAETLVVAPFERLACNTLADTLRLDQQAHPGVLLRAKDRISKALAGSEFEVRTAATAERDKLRESIMSRLSD